MQAQHMCHTACLSFLLLERSRTARQAQTKFRDMGLSVGRCIDQRAVFGAFSGLDVRENRAIAFESLDEYLYPTPRLLLSIEPGWDDSGVIEDQQIAWL